MKTLAFAIAIAMAHGFAPAGDLHADDAFPPSPDASELRALNDVESKAGVVVLESVRDLTGLLTWEKNKPGGDVTRSCRYRYLVLDSAGSELLSNYPFFRDAPGDIQNFRGRTVMPDGSVHALDPATDLRMVRIVVPGENTPRVVRTVALPRLEPGTILDLAWSQHTADQPGLELIPLQEGLPVRRARVKAGGQLQRGRTLVVPTPIFVYGSWRPGYYWIPFFAGGTPPRATAVLDPAFNVELEVTDIPPAFDEPASPTWRQVGYTLGLMPRAFAARKKIDREEWLNHLVLFGTPGTVPLGDGEGAIRLALDPAASMIRFDDCGFQEAPLETWSRLGLLDPLQESLKARHAGLAKRWKLKPSAARVETIAPPNLSWQERARRLFEYSRETIAIDPAALTHEKVAELLKDGKGSPLDRAAFLQALLRNAGIPSRLQFAMSRLALPFHPVVGQAAPFLPGWVLEIGPPGEKTLHVMPGLRNGSFTGLPEAYAGALAFEQPAGAGDPWALTRLPRDAWREDLTEVDTRSSYEPDEPNLSLLVKATLSGEAAARFRRELETAEPAPVNREEHRRQVIERWFLQWAGTGLTGSSPAIAEQGPRDVPLVLELGTAWPSAAEPHGEEVLLRALPAGSVFGSPFVASTRQLPIWLVAGRRRLSHTWSLPSGADLAELPPPIERMGPRGLSFTFEVAQGTAASDTGGARITARLTVNLPSAIPASEYADLKAFFEDLERAAGARLRLRPARVAGDVSRRHGASPRSSVARTGAPTTPESTQRP